MLATHRVVPLPAYGLKGNLIHPKNYKDALAGALVRVNFKLSHWYFSSQKEASNIFVADVIAIRVLEEPVVIKTPTKRKTSKMDPIMSSPSRKRRKD